MAVIGVSLFLLVDNFKQEIAVQYESGYNLGYSKGLQTGEASGYEQGKQEGYNSGHTVGVQAGEVTGFSRGNKTGYNTGYQNGYSVGNSEGYLQGVKDGAGTGYNIRDPTYAEMLAFIESDQTDKNTYNIDNYNCYDFTRDVCNSAFNAGYRAGDVYIEFPDSAHAIVCFNTVDKGLIFIEPQYDEEMTVTIGIEYWNRGIYEAPDFDDTIVKYGIIW